MIRSRLSVLGSGIRKKEYEGGEKIDEKRKN